MQEGKGIKICDLKSRNGTQVNEVSVKEKLLQHGDHVAIGDSIFLFLTDEGEAETGQVEFDDSNPTHTTSRIHPKDVLYLQPEKILSELPATSKLARNLNALLKISRVVHAIRELNELQEQVLTLTFEVAPAERGAILLDGKQVEHFSSVFARNRVPEDPRPVKVSRTVARQVLEQGVAILGSDVPSIGGYNKVESLIVSQVRSFLCVPMTVFHKVIGCIYLDTTDSNHRFDEDDLQLVTAIAGISAVALENARRLQWLEEENERLNTEVNLEHSMVGEAPKMKEVFQLLSRVAPTDSTVLVGGDSGTGKELAARALHLNSQRASRPFVAINCAAIPDSLLESELFGHEKGAFTGAVVQKKGKIEAADGGTLFLDEIGEISPALQVKLLRVLQEREFERVGSNRTMSVDLRLIAASNRDLRDCVKQGTFREDLYYRLNVVQINMPALRDRREDVPLLARYFIEKHSAKIKVKPKVISPEALMAMRSYDWPGNVRELENAIERALVMGSSDMILPEDLPESLMEVESGSSTSAKYHVAVKDLKKRLILGALEEAKGSYTDAARLLGVHPNYLHRLIRNLELKEHLKGGGPSTRPPRGTAA